jgi:hypothetical protein
LLFKIQAILPFLLETSHKSDNFVIKNKNELHTNIIDRCKTNDLINKLNAFINV